MKSYGKLTIQAMFLSAVIAGSVYGQNRSQNEIIRSMNMAAEMWNKGDLDGYMSLYDPHATMMMPGGRIDLDSIRKIYVRYYFNGTRPKQELSYDDYQLTGLGKNYVLLTGRFILKATDRIPERTGRFSVVLIHDKNGWKILHDHSG